MNRGTWIDNVIRPAMVSAMLGCVALSLVDLLGLFFAVPNRALLIVACVLSALESSFTYRLVRARGLRGNELLGFRATELVAVLLLVKIGSLWGKDWPRIVAHIQTWPGQPWKILDLETALAFAFALFAHFVSTMTARDLAHIGESVEEDRYDVPPVRRLVGRFFWGGVLLLTVTGLVRTRFTALVGLSQPSGPSLVIHVLAYFLLGLAMLGQIHFTTLHRQWQGQGIRVSKGLGWRWLWYSLVLIGLAASVALLLPTGYTIGLLDVAVVLIAIAGQFLWFLYGLLSLPFFLPFLRGLFLPRPRFPPLRSPTPAPGETGYSGPLWLLLVRSFLFWAIFLWVVSYVIRLYLRGRPRLTQRLVSLRPLRYLGEILAALWRYLTGLFKAAGARFPRPRSLRRAARGREPGRRSARPLPPRPRSPRERILHYYLDILARAGRRGHPRRRSQTPEEYGAALSPYLFEARHDLALLTQAFVEARYSLHPIDREQARKARSEWQQVRAALWALPEEGEGGTGGSGALTPKPSTALSKARPSPTATTGSPPRIPPS